MDLLPKFGLFCKQLGSNPFADCRLNPHSDTLDNSSAFGLGAIISVETDTIKVTVGPRPALDFAEVLKGQVALYRVLDTRNDYIISTMSFDKDMIRDDGSWVIKFCRVDDHRDLWVAAILSLKDGTSVASIAKCVTDISHKAIALPTQMKPRSDFSTPHEALSTVPEKVITIKDEVMAVSVQLDFTKPKPVIVGDGSLTYVGGGSRYLPTPNGPVVQQLNQAPWALLSPTFVEPDGGNELVDFALLKNSWQWTSTGKPDVVEAFFELPGFSERLIGFDIAESEGLNQTWELVLQSMDWDGRTVSGSSFAQVYSNGSNLKAEIGIRLMDGQVVRDESWSNLPVDQDLGVHGSSWYLKQNAQPVAGTIQLVVRVKNINRGDVPRVIVGFPQIEYAPVPGSRSTGRRVADDIQYASNSKFYNECGKFEVEFAPLYEGVPKGAGPQLLLDTRDSTGRNGFWLAHRANGLFEFGSSDALGHTFIQSSSTVPLKEGQKYKLTARWDSESKNMRIDLDHAKLIDKELSTILIPTTLTKYRLGTRYDGSHRSAFQLYSFKHEQANDY